MESYRVIEIFKDALGNLTVFKSVEVKIRRWHCRLGWCSIIWLHCKMIDARLAITLDKSHAGYVEGVYRLAYHPRRG